MPDRFSAYGMYLTDPSTIFATFAPPTAGEGNEPVNCSKHTDIAERPSTVELTREKERGIACEQILVWNVQ